MRNTPTKAIDAADGTSNPASEWLPANQWFAFSATCIGTGTIAGTLKVQISNDPIDTKQADIVGFDLPSAAVTLSTLKGVIPKLDSAYNWVRLVFTSSGGAGAVVARLKASGF